MGIYRLTKKHEQGFTIVELMIALAVFSAMLTMGTVVMVRISGLLDQGVSASNLQSTARNVVSDVASAIQFGGVSPLQCAPASVTTGPTNVCVNNYTYSYPVGGQTVPEYAYCVGTTRYSFILYTELGSDSANNPIYGIPANTSVTDILWRDTLQSANNPCYPVYLINPKNTTYPADTEAVPNSGQEMMANNTRLTSFQILPVTANGVSIYQITITSALGNSDLVNINLNNPGNSTCNSTLGGISTDFCSTSAITTTAEARVY